VFEQSVLPEGRTNRPLTFVAFVTAELFVVAALILVPLAYNDRLPGFHWRDVVVSPPPLKAPEILVNPGSTAPALPGQLRYPRPFIQSTPVLHAEPIADRSGIFDPGTAPDVMSSGNPTGNGDASSLVILPAQQRIAPPPDLSRPPRDEPRPGPIRVSAGVQMAKLVKKVVPEYPPLARATRTSGVVHLIGTIARDGTIRNLQLVSGHPLLARAALEAVQQWVYQPTLLNGEPVEVIAPIDVNFTLGSQ